MGIAELIDETTKTDINILDYKEAIDLWSLNRVKELSRYGMTQEDFFNDLWLKCETHKGQIMETKRIHNRNTKALILLICNRHLIDLRRKHIKCRTQSIDAETATDNNETLADTIRDNGIDFSLLVEMVDSIPDRQATKTVSYKQLFQIILDEGNEPTRLAEILNVSNARVSQITHELIRYMTA